jgi:hypothetical protein
VSWRHRDVRGAGGLVSSLRAARARTVRRAMARGGGGHPLPGRQSAEHGARKPALQGSRYRIAWRPGAAQDSRPRHQSWRVRKPSPGAGADLAVPNLLRTTSCPACRGVGDLLARLQCHSTRRLLLSGCQVRRSRIPAAADRGHRASATGCAMRETGSCFAHHPVHPPEALDAAGVGWVRHHLPPHGGRPMPSRPPRRKGTRQDPSVHPTGFPATTRNLPQPIDLRIARWCGRC